MPHDVDDLSQRQEVMRRINENPHRLEVLCGESGILKSKMFHDLQWRLEPPVAPLADLLRVHEYSYIHRLKEAVLKLPQDRAVPSQGEGFRDAWMSKDTWDRHVAKTG